MYYALLDGNRISALKVKSKYGVIDHLIVSPIREAGKTGRLHCEYCGEEVIFRCGDVRDPHFSHLAGSNCVEKTTGFAFESNAHRDGVLLLQEFFQKFATEDVCIGVRLENGRRPNLLITDERGRLAIEFVSNSLPQDWVQKNKSYHDNGIPCLWILDYSTSISEIIQREIQACNLGNMMVYLDGDKNELVFERQFEYRDDSGELVETRSFEYKTGLDDTIFLLDGFRFDVNFDVKFNDAYNQYVSERKLMLAKLEAERLNALEVEKQRQESIRMQKAIFDAKREAAEKEDAERRRREHQAELERRKREYQAELERQEAEARDLAKQKEVEDRRSTRMLQDLIQAAEHFIIWANDHSISLPVVELADRRAFHNLARAYLNNMSDYTDLMSLARLLCHEPNLVVKYGHDAKRMIGVFEKVQSQDPEQALMDRKNKIDTVRNDLCPHCGKVLRVRKGPYSDFMGCSGYPTCRYSRRI